MQLNFKNLAVVAALLCSHMILADEPISNDIPVSQLLKTATIHLAAGRAQDALSYFDAAIARDPSNYLSIFKRGAAFLSLGRSVQAERDFNTVLGIKPDFEGALIQRAKLHGRNGDWDAAKTDWIAAGKAHDAPELTELDEAQGAAILAEKAEEAQKWDECISQASVALRVAPTVLKLRQLRSRCRFEIADIAAAVGDLQHVLLINSGTTEPHLQVSAHMFFSLAEPDKGLTQVRKCLQSDPDNKQCRSLLRTQKALVKRLRQLEQHLHKKSYASAIRVLIKSTEDQGLIEDAKQEFQQLRTGGMIHHKAPNALYDKLIESTCEAYVKSKKYLKGQAFCEQALKTNPTSLYGLLSKAKAQMQAEDYEAAKRTLADAQAHHESNTLENMVNEVNNLLRLSKQKDYYKILGVGRDADAREIKRAYRKLSKEFHPDKASAKGIPREEAQKKMAAINEAYETLSDPELKSRVDGGEDPNDPQQQQQGGHPFHGSHFSGFGQGQQFVFRSGPGGFGSGGFEFPGGFPGFQ